MTEMDSDDDFQSYPSQEEPSPQIQLRKLKRLKKTNTKSPAKSLLEPIDDPLLHSSVDFSKLEALENGSEALDFNDSNSGDDPFLYQESESQGNINENEDKNKDTLDNGSNAGVKMTKRALEFDVEHVGDVVEPSIDIDLEKIEKEQSSEEIFTKEDGKKRKNNNNKRGKSDKTEKAVNKRREEKERKAYLKELHAESQRLLRESSDAAFKPIPITRKPISSIIEKIRKRKLELSKKFGILHDQTCVSEDEDSLREKMDFDVLNINETKTVEKDMVTSGVDARRSSNPPKLDICDDIVRSTNHEDVNQELNEEPMLPFRAPLQDTEDLFDDSQSNDIAVERDLEKQSGPLDKEFAPSLLDINLKLDSVPTDDSSSDDEDNDKENVDPHHIIPGGSSPKGDPVKNFFDDEAEEEDDSDHDPDHLHENEEDDVENYEELEDMIATEYEERPIDKERRNKLHQQWLEQQDATGTDNLLQRLKCGPGMRDTNLPDKEPESGEDDEEFDDDDDEAQEQTVPRNSARVTTKKAKQIILQLFSDKEDVYLSDNDENTDWRNAKQRFIRNEKGTLVSPGDDEDSREVFGLIKKLDIASGNKKKPKPSSFFDSVLKGGNNNSSSKSSFLGRMSNHQIPSSKKQRSGTVRSFIFGRDDSSSRSSITMSEDSLDAVSQDIHPTRSFAVKHSSSQTKYNSSKSIDDAASTTSLLEVLKRSSSQVHICNQDTTVDLTKSIFSLRVPKKSVKIQGRS